ncbi:MAG TPA: DinB family protein [Pyrinomonadaceae bacterium]|nr:DinB family protein [Pyrinomonadaceae bacterium]
MIYTSVPQIFQKIDETRERIFKRVEGLSDEQLNSRPAPNAWSVAEIVEHLAKIESLLLGMMKMMLMKAESVSQKSDGAHVEFKPFSLDEFIERARNEKFTAPESASPSGKEHLSNSLAQLRRSREELQSLSPRIEAIDLANVTYRHPAFGPLNFYQWLAFIGIHEERHLRQIESALSS